jgi:hypothetical protein
MTISYRRSKSIILYSTDGSSCPIASRRSKRMIFRRTSGRDWAWIQRTCRHGKYTMTLCTKTASVSHIVNRRAHCCQNA